MFHILNVKGNPQLWESPHQNPFNMNPNSKFISHHSWVTDNLEYWFPVDEGYKINRFSFSLYLTSSGKKWTCTPLLKIKLMESRLSNLKQNLELSGTDKWSKYQWNHKECYDTNGEFSISYLEGYAKRKKNKLKLKKKRLLGHNLLPTNPRSTKLDLIRICAFLLSLLTLDNVFHFYKYVTISHHNPHFLIQKLDFFSYFILKWVTEFHFFSINLCFVKYKQNPKNIEDWQFASWSGRTLWTFHHVPLQLQDPSSLISWRQNPATLL